MQSDHFQYNISSTLLRIQMYNGFIPLITLNYTCNDIIRLTKQFAPVGHPLHKIKKYWPCVDYFVDFCHYFSRSRLEEVSKDILQFRIGTSSTRCTAVVFMINRINVCLKHGGDVRVVPEEKCVIWQYVSHSPQCGPGIVVIHRQKMFLLCI